MSGTTLSKTSLKWLLFAVAFTGYVLLVASVLRLTLKDPASPRAATLPAHSVITHAQEPQPPGLPVRLRIPALNIDSAIYYVSIAPDGAMDVNKNPDKVAWYQLGPRPGTAGSAVIAGHYGWEAGEGSVFNELHTLKTGDVLSIEDDKRRVISFAVRESREYDPGANADEVFNSNDGKAHLNLITCGGVWNESQKTYSHRLVTFTDQISG